MLYELPRDILVHGVFSTRKTSVAMTASSNYPTVGNAPFKEPVTLNDVAVLAWDSQGCLGLPHLGINLPAERIFKTTGRVIPTGKPGAETGLEAESIVSIINDSRKWAIEQAKAGVKYFIHDTISTKDTKIVGFWTDLVEKDNSGKNDSAQKIYRNVLTTHAKDLEFWQNFAAHYGAFNIWLCHTTIKGQDAPSQKEEAKKQAEIQRKAKGMLGAELAARITGQSWNYFYENCRAVYYQEIATMYGAEQAIWTTRSDTIAVKPGLPKNVLPDQMPADFRKLFKIAAGEKV